MMQEGAAVARSYVMAKNYHVDGNKEMIAFWAMNMSGSCTSCYLTASPFSRSAVNRDAGCRTALPNAVMAAVVALTLLFLTPLFRHTPQASLSAMLVNVDLPAAARLWRVDKPDFFVCLGAFLGVVFGSVEIGLCVAVGASVLRVLLLVARPRTTALGRMPGSAAYRRMDQYAVAEGKPGVLVLRIDAPVYFANASYLRERIARWMDEEDDRIKAEGGEALRCVVLDMGCKFFLLSICNTSFYLLYSISKYLES
jgi:sulfate transporter 3